MFTTININTEHMNYIAESAQKAGVSRSILILNLLKEFQSTQHKNKPRQKVVYQEPAPAESWHTFHLSLSESEYNHLLDMRRYFKMSVSLIIALAIGRYLSSYLSGITGIVQNTDSYRFPNYIFTEGETYNGIRYFVQYWGVPDRVLNYYRKIFFSLQCNKEKKNTPKFKGMTMKYIFFTLLIALISITACTESSTVDTDFVEYSISAASGSKYWSFSSGVITACSASINCYAVYYSGTTGNGFAIKDASGDVLKIYRSLGDTDYIGLVNEAASTTVSGSAFTIASDSPSSGLYTITFSSAVTIGTVTIPSGAVIIAQGY